MISPCMCKGSMRNVHFGCLQTWIQTKLMDLAQKSNVIDLDQLKCDICKVKLENKHFDIQTRKALQLIDPIQAFPEHTSIVMQKLIYD